MARKINTVTHKHHTEISTTILCEGKIIPVKIQIYSNGINVLMRNASNKEMETVINIDSHDCDYGNMDAPDHVPSLFVYQRPMATGPDHGPVTGLHVRVEPDDSIRTRKSVF
jgi:hypothetical protein